MKKTYLTILMVLCAISIFASETPGVSCANAITATADDGNEHTLGSYTDQWYRYTATRDCKILLENLSIDGSSYYYIYSNCQGYSDLDGYNKGKFQCSKDVTYYIKWRNYRSENFNWSLSEEDLLDGEFCNVAIAATSTDNNSFTLNQGEEQWFSFTPTQSGKLILSNITTDGNSDYFVYNTCSDYGYSNSGNTSGYFNAEEGKEYLIKWTNNNPNSFEWTIEYDEFIEGEDCSTASSVNFDGNNNYTFSNGLTQWYKYTASKFCRIKLNNITTDISARYRVYTSCGNNYSNASGFNNGSFEAQAGETFYISWYDASDVFSWTLEEEDYLDGEKCDVAIEASASADNQFNFAHNTDQWFSYTAILSGKIEIKNLSSTANSSYSVYTQCGYWSDISGDNEGFFKAEAGVTYYVKWRNYDVNNFNWSLEETEFVIGEDCSTPITVNTEAINVHTFGKGIKQWYIYKATKNGIIELNNLSLNPNSEYEVFTSSCSKWNNYSGYNMGSFVCTEGITYTISWINNTIEDFSWSIIEREFQEGEDCSIPITATIGSDNEYNLYGSQWFSYTAAKDGKITLNNLSDEVDGNFTVYTQCESNYIAYNSNLCVFESTLGTTYLIKCDNYGLNSFNWSISEEDIELGDFCFDPIEVDADVSIEHDKGKDIDQWYQFTASVTGKVIYENLSEVSGIRFEAFTSCDTWNMYSTSYSEGYFEVEAGITYLFKLINNSGDKFEWKITNVVTEPGDFCNNPVEVYDNQDIAVVNEFGNWFSYTATLTGNINIRKTISDNNYNNISVYNGCNNYVKVEQNELDFFAIEGETYLINWSNSLGAEFDWVLTANAYSEAEHCSTAILANEGEANVHEGEIGEYKWYYYIAKTSGTVTVSVNNGGLAELGIKSNCTNSSSLNNISQNSITQSVSQGNVYYFYINSKQSDPLTYSINEGDLIEGTDCSNGIPVSLDQVYSTPWSGYYYYTFEATSSGKLTFETTNKLIEAELFIRKSCVQNLFQGNTNTVSFYVEEGDIITFRVFNYYSSVMWSLSLTDYEVGEDCTTAIIANLDDQITHNSTIDETVYHELTADITGKVVVKSITEGSDAFVSIKRDCGLYSFIKSGVNELFFDAEEGTTYYISWTNNIASDFNWTITEESYNEGEHCSFAEEMRINNSYDWLPGISEKWFKYTPAEDIKLHVATLDSDKSELIGYDIYKACGTQVFFEGYESSGWDAIAGVTYYIKVYGNIDETIKWQLSPSVSDDTAGNTCDEAIPVVIDTDIEYTKENYLSQWFIFEAQVDGVADIVTSDNSSLNTYWYLDCNDRVSSGRSMRVKKGQLYYLDIEAWKSCTWQISEREFYDYEICEDAITAPIAESILFDNDLKTRWYEYTATQTGKTTLTANGSVLNAYVSVSNNCNLSSINSSSNIIEFSAEEGMTYYIEWVNNSAFPFEWIINEGGSYDLGEGCLNPISVESDTDINFTSNLNKDVWYSYTAAEDGKVTINKNDDFWGSTFKVYNNCSSNYMASGSNFSTFVVEKGQTYLIKWSTGYGIPEFTWTITESELLAGEFCNSAHTSIEGNNTYKGENAQWFVYIPEEDQQIKVSSCDKTDLDTKLYVFESCENSKLIAYNDDVCKLQSEIVFSALAGVEYYIAWSVKGDAQFEWDLSVVGDNAVKKTDYTSFSMYPNPANSYININSVNIISYVRILSTQGLVVQENSNPTSQLKLNLNKGIYIVEVYFENGSTATQKLIIQ
ncbi:T9SS type A sorting domain-containing protein [Saccharicrinis aurantiacus]|uniref:T9SS type A sorting domain-containing protein n=1 Tax=Saccharicrinis aurantiacus TaxID=1849719 RepID=UPI0024930E15|nr:T9SS type A sorting domain-containing protein [Saccharicrinis aurantiacus]